MKKLLAIFLMLGSMAVMATPVNVNTADAATLAAALHGIGMKKAADIVAYREAHGPFKSLADLGNVKGVGDKTLAKNQADIQFGGAASAPAAVAPAAAPVAPAVAAPAVQVPAAPAGVLQKAAGAAKAAVANPLK